jgi:hypothetical protein
MTTYPTRSMPIPKAIYPVFVKIDGIYTLPIDNSPLYNLIHIKFVVTKYKETIPMVLK